MDIQKEAEQTLKEIFGTEWIDVHPDFRQKYIDLILQSFERICREQRKACATNYSKRALGYMMHHRRIIIQTPLLTDNK